MAKTSLANLSVFLFFSRTLKVSPKGLFIDNRIILVLHKLYQYEQHRLRGKENLNPTWTGKRTWKENYQNQH